MATPYRGKQITLHQPDGTPLQVRAWGNQYHAMFETLEGYTVVRNPASGAYEFARLSDDRDELVATGGLPGIDDPRGLGLGQALGLSPEAVRAAAREQAPLPRGTSRWEERRREEQERLRMAAVTGAPPRRQTVGTYVGLCLLIEFPDVQGTIAPAEVEAFCNQKGYAGFGNVGSVRDYFYEVSNRQLEYRNIVTPGYYTAKQRRSYYTDPQVPQPDRARELIKEALQFWKKQGFDFAQLTTDEQGYVYATNVFYAGNCVNDWAQGLWPHAFHLKTRVPLAPGVNAYDYQITDMTDELSLGTFCHENGHMVCDFPDLYDYGDESAGVGAFCLMCGGANVDPKNPTHVGAYLKYRAGWATSLVALADGMQATASAGANQFFVHRKNLTEYFIVENRYRQGRDRALPDQGLAVWHVDETGDNSHEQMTPERHYECTLVQADGRHDLESDRSNQGDVGDLFAAPAAFGPAGLPASTWWDGSPSHLDLHSISAAGETMTFGVRLPV